MFEEIAGVCGDPAIRIVAPELLVGSTKSGVLATVVPVLAAEERALTDPACVACPAAKTVTVLFVPPVNGAVVIVTTVSLVRTNVPAVMVSELPPMKVKSVALGLAANEPELRVSTTVVSPASVVNGAEAAVIVIVSPPLLVPPPLSPAALMTVNVKIAGANPPAFVAVMV